MSLYLENNNFIRHVTILSGASVVAQLINIVSMPIVSRLYSPNDFGVLALYSSIVGLLATISGFRYYLVIPLVRRERYIQALAWLSLISQCFCVLTFAIIIEICKMYLEDTSYGVLLPYRYLIPVGVLCVGIYSTVVQWAIREKEFTLIAKTKLVQTVSRCSIFFMCGFINAAPIGLLLGDIAGQSGGSTSIFYSIMKKIQKVKFSFTHIKRAALSYRKMFLFDTPSSLINMSGAYLLPIIMTYYWIPDIVGSFSMAQQVLALPSAVIGTAIGQVFIQRCSQAKHDGNIEVLYLKTLKLLFITGVGPILLISMLAPVLFPIILGSKWAEAGKFAMMMSPWVALNFIYSPLSMIYVIMMLQRPAFVFLSLYTIARIASLYIMRGNPDCAIELLSGVGAFFMVVGIIWPGYFIYIKISSLISIITCLSVNVLIALAPVYFCLYVFKNIPIYATIIAMLLSMALYIWLGVKTLKNIKK